MKKFFSQFTLSTKEGCLRLLALFLCVILATNFLAMLLSTDNGKIKIEKIIIDARGSELEGLLYYPVGTTDKDSLPAIIVAHGGGNIMYSYRGISEELAKRGFVVFNVNTYGAGNSGMPQYDEAGQGVEGKYNYRVSPAGYYDALEFLRGLSFVDSTRIGITGHSAGGVKAGNTAVMDCGYLTFNDQMINVLYERFGQTFTQEEIYQDADELAAARLTDDQLALYNEIRSGIYEKTQNSLKSLVLIGMTSRDAIAISTVEVGGYEVPRSANTNIAVVGGWYDNLAKLNEEQQAGFYPNGDIVREQWYAIDHQTQTSQQLGDIKETSRVTNDALNNAIENRATRVVVYNKEVHSMNNFSHPTAADIARIFEQTLGYNNGDLGAAGSNPLPVDKVSFKWRTLLNGIGMLCMLSMMIPLAKLLLQTRFFAPCVAPYVPRPKKFRKSYISFTILSIAFGALALHMVNVQQRGIFGIDFAVNKFFPLFPAGWQTLVILLWLSIGAVVILICNVVLDKKFGDELAFRALNINVGLKNFFKALLLSLALILAGYITVVVSEYIFGQDLSLWQIQFLELKLENWGTVFRYTLTYIPLFLITTINLNYNTREDCSETKDMILSMVYSSLGMWLLCAVTMIVLYSSDVGEPFTVISSFGATFSFLLFVPLRAYINRKLYRMTNSVWLGVLLNSLIAAWAVVGALGSNGAFPGVTFAEKFFGF